MSNNFKKLAGEFLSSSLGNKDNFEQLANSPDGQKIKAMLDNRGVDLQSAMDSGNISALKAALSDILKTDTGAKFAQQVSDLLKNK